MNNKIDNSNLLNEEKIENNSLIVTDALQIYITKNFSNQKKTLMVINELIFYGVFIYYYYLGPIGDSVTNFALAKFLAVIFVVRYSFNFFTHFTDNKTKQTQTYFQLNSKVAIFSAILLFLTGQEVNITTLLLIFSYGIFSSAAHYGYTVDNIITCILVYFLFTSNLVK